MIYDCFTFFNELELLDLRLATLASTVDRFVLAESAFTHQGRPKPLYFDANRSRYSAYLDVIDHVVVDHIPMSGDRDARALERYQRNSIARALTSARPDDTIVVSDVDEIPSPAQIRRNASARGTTLFDVRLHYYSLDLALVGNPYRWSGARPAMRRLGSGIFTPQALRDLATTLCAVGPASGLRVLYNPLRRWTLRRQHGVRIIPEGGWHFSYLGGPDAIQAKLSAIAEGELATVSARDAIARAIGAGDDIFGRGLRFARVDIDRSFPEPVYSDPDRYRSLMVDALIDQGVS